MCGRWGRLHRQLGVSLRPTREACCELCPLNRVKTGIAVRVRQLCAAPEVSDRLREIGFGEDQVVRLITNQANLICQVCNTRLAISEKLAGLILVEPVPAPVRVG